LSAYRRGRAYEYKVKKQLEREGWTVLRTAGSHGLFDLIAINPPGHSIVRMAPDAIGVRMRNEGDIKLIQCKTGKTKKRMISEVEKTNIGRYEGLYSVSVEVV
jgi:Holliday junction resolvase-like predicted endonuclease